MSIKLQVTEQDKKQMANLSMECQVLNNLLVERRAALQNKVGEILTTNALSPKLYVLKFNPGKDLWEAELKVGVIAVPTQEMKRVKLN